MSVEFWLPVGQLNGIMRGFGFSWGLGLGLGFGGRGWDGGGAWWRVAVEVTIRL